MAINGEGNASKEGKPAERKNILDLTDYYEILGVKSDASLAEITDAYKKLAIMYHPDKHAGLPQEFQDLATEIFKKIGDAYEKLQKKHRFQVYNNPKPQSPRNPEKETHPENKAFEECKADILRASIADDIDAAIMAIRAFNARINFNPDNVIISVESFKAPFTKNGQKTEFKITRFNNGILTSPPLENNPKEISEKYIQNSNDFEELYIMITLIVNKYGPIQGSRESYSAEEIIGFIDEVREKPSLISFITNTFGIRDKVKQLLKARDNKK